MRTARGPVANELGEIASRLGTIACIDDGVAPIDLANAEFDQVPTHRRLVDDELVLGEPGEQLALVANEPAFDDLPNQFQTSRLSDHRQPTFLLA